MTNIILKNNLETEGRVYHKDGDSAYEVSISEIYNTVNGTINILNLGATANELVDNHAIIQNALDSYTNVYIPEGIYGLSEELKIPSNTNLFGDGIDLTILKLMDSTNRDQCVITNEQNTRDLTNTGNINITIRDLTVDGNRSRTTDYSSIPATSACGIGLTYTSNSILSRVKAVDCIKHGIDISAKIYNVTGDSATSYQEGASKNIKIEFCESYGQGDDGITTHFSHNIVIIEPLCGNSGNFYSVDNSNGLEIDDGSYNVRVFGGKSFNNSRGIQIKAHDYAPSARNIKVFGLTCENNTQNFVLLHDEFYTEATTSASAYDVLLDGCTSVLPMQKESDAKDIRALNIASYSGVILNNFTVIGSNNEYPESGLGNTTAEKAIAIYGNARNITFNNLTIDGVIQATDALIYLTSACHDITFNNIVARECRATILEATSTVVGIAINGLKATTSETVNVATGIIADNASIISIINTKMVGYTDKFLLDGVATEDFNIYHKDVGENVFDNDIKIQFADTSSNRFFKLENLDTATVADDSYGGVAWIGNDASNDSDGVRAMIEVVSKGTTGKTAMMFSTAGGATAREEKMMLDNNGDLSLFDNGAGIKLKSPNGTEYELTVSDAGVLVIT